MAPCSKKMKEKEVENGRDLPPDVLRHLILPQLSFKSLSRFRCVSKGFRELLSPQNKEFSTEQSINPTFASTGFVYLDMIKGLQFLPKPSEIGVPDPHLNFLPKLDELNLLSSSNGLLLFHHTTRGEIFDKETGNSYRPNTFSVCNPARMEMHTVPNDESYVVRTPPMALYFDPHKSADRFVVVDATLTYRRTVDDSDATYIFNVFHSEMGEWELSEETVPIKKIRHYCLPSVSITAGTKIYWNCVEHLLWFDAEREKASSLPLPYDGLPMVDIGVLGEQIYCTAKKEESLEIWLLKDEQWERKRELKWDTIISATLEAFRTMNKKRKVTEPSLDSWDKGKCSRSVAFDGNKLYLIVKRNSRCKKELLLCFEVETGRASNICEIKIERGQILPYHNSLVKLPEVVYQI